jgi:hypothetical protein
MDRFLVVMQAHGATFALEVLAPSLEEAEIGGRLLLGAVRAERVSASVPADEEVGKFPSKAAMTEPAKVEIPLGQAPDQPVPAAAAPIEA